MSVSALDGNIKKLSAEYIGGTDAATDHCGSCTVDAGIGALGSSETKLHDTVSLCSIADSGGFSGNQTLVIDNIQNSGFYKLCLHDGGYNLHQWLSGKDNGSLGNGINVTGELKVSKIIEKILFKNTEACKIVDILS